VAVNYRLGALGFLALDQLKQENQDSSTGNYGLQDQRFGMQWVQRNVHIFGGDPTRVTIFGESAGAFSVCWHLASSMSRGLFHAAIMESGTCDSNIFFLDYGRATSWSKFWAGSTGCNSNASDLLTCLRNLNTTASVWVPKDLNSQNMSGSWLPLLYPDMPWAPAVDQSVAGLMDVPIHVISRAEGNPVPLIAGTNENEGSIFMPELSSIVPGVKFPLTSRDVETTLNHFFCANSTIVQNIIEMYPKGNTYTTYPMVLAMILRDYFFVCPTRRAQRELAKNFPSYPYRYHFAYEMHDPIFNVFGDYHGSEINYVFSNPWPFDDHSLRNWTDVDQAMADAFGAYWSNMVHNQQPNYDEVVPILWPVWDPVSELNVRMEIPVVLEAHYLTPQCNFWDTTMQQCAYCLC